MYYFFRKQPHFSEKNKINLAYIFLALVFLVPGLVFATSSSSDEQSKNRFAFGENDTLGAVNLLQSSDVIRAIKTVKSGKVYSLALETNSNTPAYGDRSYSVKVFKGSKATGTNKVTGLDDQVTMHLGIGTQIDGLGHIGSNFVHYNGVHLNEFYSENGLKKFGTSEIPPIVTRGILLDMTSWFGVDRVAEGTAYNVKEIEGVLEKQGLTIEKGDVVIFHSGWNSLLGQDNKRWLSAHPGPGEQGAKYLASKGIVAVGADSAALEVIPFEKEGKVFPVHQELLVNNGVYVLEAINTAELAADGVFEFMFVLGIPKLAGTVQAIIHPLAIK